MAFKRKISLILISALLFGMFSAGRSLAFVEQIPFNKKQKAEMVVFKNAYDLKLRINNQLFKVVLANVNCHNFNRARLLKGPDNLLYILPRSASIRRYSKANDYLKDIFDNNANNLYFTPYVRTYRGDLVGDLYVGDKNINLILMQKGLCSRL